MQRIEQMASFDLTKYDVQLRMGRATLLLCAYNGDVPGVSVSEDIDANLSAFRDLGLADEYIEEVPTVTYAAPRGAVLHLGESIQIGRSIGVKIHDADEGTDQERRILYDWTPLEAVLSRDLTLSNVHAEILSAGAKMAEVRDLDSTNGTWFRLDHSRL